MHFLAQCTLIAQCVQRPLQVRGWYAPRHVSCRWLARLPRPGMLMTCVTARTRSIEASTGVVMYLLRTSPQNMYSIFII